MDYSKYKFNYFDVVKRHERIINRPKDWEIKVLAIIMLMVTFLYTFTSFAFCSELEEVDFSIVNGIRIRTDTNYFSSGDGSSYVGYLELEKGYIYHISKVNSGTSYAQVALCNNTPALNVPYNFLTAIAPGQSYSYIPSNDDYLIISFNTNSDGSTINVTREKIDSYEGAVSDLVDNVGVNQVWEVFGNGVDFIGVVVLVAFGLFLVVLAIKKVSKGKSEF